MKASPDQMTVRDLVALKKNQMLMANPEYQRGSVWTVDQQKRLVDSLFREYPLPLIYLHRRHIEVAGLTRDALEVIDGQQRTNALFDFSEGAFKLFDPKKDAERARFPSFVQDAACPWGGLNFDGLSAQLREQFLNTPLSVVYVETDLENEARDLFIRLQAGLPLNPQEKRDAWPGNFTDFVLKVGGKPEIARYPGHEFFSAAMKSKANTRGEVRQLVAQMMMLLTSWRKTRKLCSIKRDEIDDFYYQHLAFDLGCADAKRLEKILDVMVLCLREGKRRKIQGYEAISLVLLVESLLDDYVQGWQSNLSDAFDSFRLKAAQGSKTRWDASPDEFWTQYGILARTNTDRAETIERRHAFFSARMYETLKPQLLDPTRLFVGVERELVYYRDGKKCQAIGCGTDVEWDDAEVHHVKIHSKGGETTLANGALVHKKCHPKGDSAVAKFAIHWAGKQGFESA